MAGLQSDKNYWLQPPADCDAVRVLLAGEQPIVLVGLSQVIDAAPQRFFRVGTVGRFQELHSHPALPEADVLFLDLGLHLASSIRFLPELISDLSLKVIVLTDDANIVQHEDAVKNGALGVVLKSQPSSLMLDAIERVHAGEAWVERSLMASLISGRTMMNGKVSASASGDEHTRRIASLTPRERQVVAALVEQRGAKGFVVAEALGISEQTLRNRLTFIYDKLRIRGKLDLYLYAMEHGLGPVSAVPQSLESNASR